MLETRTQYSPTAVRWLDNGGAIVRGTLITPEDAVRMLIRTMGRDPDAPEWIDVPARMVRHLHDMRLQPVQVPCGALCLETHQ